MLAHAQGNSNAKMVITGTLLLLLKADHFAVSPVKGASLSPVLNAHIVTDMHVEALVSTVLVVHRHLYVLTLAATLMEGLKLHIFNNCLVLQRISVLVSEFAGFACC